jgi:glycosyltransferase involved in cell wall biosynthesis
VRDDITPLIITLDEAPNIRRTLDRLLWARRIVVVDSGSTDGTLAILRGYPQVEVIHRPFADFADQCNFGLSRIASPWALSLDADYELSPELEAEILALAPADRVAGYRARFVYRIHGRPLRRTLYPPRVVLYRPDRASYSNEGHGHRVRIDGAVSDLGAAIYHDDRKPLTRWFASQQRYARAEAEHLLAAPSASLSRADRIRRMGWPVPLGILPYALLAKGCLLDGRAGWYYALQRLVAEALIALEIADRRSRGTERK